MNRRVAMMAGAGAAVLVAALAFWWPGADASVDAGVASGQGRDPASGEPSEIAENAENSASAQSEALVAPLRAGPTAYHVKYSFALEAGARIGSLKVHAGGTLQIGAPQQRDGQTWVPLRLAGATSSMSRAAQRMLEALGKESLELPFAVRLMADGKVDQARFGADVSQTARSVLAELAFSLQLSGLAEAGPNARWTAEELSLNGTCKAVYRRDGAQIARTVASTQAQVGERSETSSTFRLEGPQVREMELLRRGKATTGGVKVAGFVPLRMAIRAVVAEAGDMAWASQLPIEGMQRFSVAGGAKRAPPKAPRDVAVVLRDVRSFARDKDVGGQVALRNELTYAIREQPRALGAVVEALRARDLGKKAETVAIAALVGARTGPAQAATAKLLGDDELDSALRVRVLQSAALMSSPNPAFVHALMELATSHKDRSYAAAVATTAGAAARYLKEQHPEQAQRVIDALTATARPIVTPRQRTVVIGRPEKKRVVKPGAVPDDPEAPKDVAPEEEQPVGVRLAWLAALGNTGDPGALQDVLAATDDNNEAVRGGAVLALRFQDPQKCIGAMIKIMATDKSIHVRENVVDAARHMGPAVTGQLVERALRFDESPFVRLAAAYTLSVWSADAPWLRKILVDALKKEKNVRVIEAIQHYVDQGRVAGQPVKGSTQMGTP